LSFHGCGVFVGLEARQDYAAGPTMKVVARFPVLS
jgi:hypothetical protein